MKAQGIVDSGDSLKLGIGAMSDARWQDFFKVMSAEGLYPKDMDWKKGYTLRFVNQRVGMARSRNNCIAMNGAVAPSPASEPRSGSTRGPRA